MGRVFISSASGALVAYRRAAVEVCHRLGHEPVFMEEFDPQRPTPEQVCRAKVEGCDVFVLLLAHRYGSRPPGGDRSFTELEYRWAVHRPGTRLLPFVVDPAFPWPPPDIDHGLDAEALAQLVAEVQQRHVVKRLAEVPTFREDLILALGQDQAAGSGTPEDGGTQEAPRTPRPPAFHAVPSYVGSAPFTGRSKHLAELDDWGRSGDPVMVVEAIGGTGKSALTWQWAVDRAPEVIDGLAGRLWWSFYDGSASMTRFLHELLAYTTGRPMKQIRRLERTDLADQVMAELRSRPYLVVLDGFERLLTAYHRFDPSKLRDEEVEPDKRSLIEPHAEDVVRQLTTAGPSRTLISTRLMPTALHSRFGAVLPGVRHLRLPGLSLSDTSTLLARLGVTGSDAAIAGFFGPLDNHPLLVGIVAGLVRDYRAEPGGFDRWLADPTAGAALNVAELDLTQRRSHILAAALEGLPSGPQRLLSWISVLSGIVPWDTLAAINPFRPEPPPPVEPDLAPLGPRPSPLDEDDIRQWRQWVAAAEPIRAEARRATQEQLEAWSASEPVMRAQAQLDAALKDLEDRGLLWWDRSSNTYDLHPIIRAFAHDQLEETDRVRANDRVRDHFQALPPEDPGRATSVEDLTQTITIFRALIGAGHLSDALQLWDEFGRTLLIDIGAYGTLLELLGPLAATNSLTVQRYLANANQFLGRYDESIDWEGVILAAYLKRSDVNGVGLSLAALGVNYRRSGAFIAADRSFGLREAVAVASGEEPDGDMVLDRAIQAVLHGKVKRARELMDQAEQLGQPPEFPWFEAELRHWQLYLALVADGSLTEEQLSDAVATARSWELRRWVASLRCQLCTRDGRLEQALAAAEDHDRLCRNAGVEIAPATTAFLLARLGRTAEAATAVEDALTRLPRIHPADRPHYDLARALRELGRRAEAAWHAREAYRRAWAEGPPYCFYWDLRDVGELLQSLGEPAPDLPAIDPVGVKIPLEDEVRAFIAKLEAERSDKPGTG